MRFLPCERDRDRRLDFEVAAAVEMLAKRTAQRRAAFRHRGRRVHGRTCTRKPGPKALAVSAGQCQSRSREARSRSARRALLLLPRPAGARCRGGPCPGRRHEPPRRGDSCPGTRRRPRALRGVACALARRGGTRLGAVDHRSRALAVGRARAAPQAVLARVRRTGVGGDG